MQKEENTPNYIKQLPWYAQDSNGGGELVKIPAFEPKGFLDQWYNRGQKGYQATTYRKGACENCGAMGHSKKQCTERPRKLGARFNQKGIAPDDVVRDVRMDWQVKRDRWNGFTPEMYSEVISEYNKYEEVRKLVKGDDSQQQLRQTNDPLATATLPSSNKKEKFQGLGGVRNREDRAKYLNNLDLNSAAFDPKSRTLAGEDEYLKHLSNLQAVGEKASLEEQDRFAFEQVDKHHAELSSTALPTLTEKIFKNVREKQAGLNSGKMGEIMRKYGVESNGQLAEVVEEHYEGEVFQRVKRIIRSRYEEDVLINDHTTVWGSWFNPLLGWGYGCCYSNEKLSYCAGVKGRERALAKELKMKTQQLRDNQRVRELEQQQEREEHEQEDDEKSKEKEGENVEEPQQQ